MIHHLSHLEDELASARGEKHGLFVPIDILQSFLLIGAVDFSTLAPLAAQMTKEQKQKQNCEDWIQQKKKKSMQMMCQIVFLFCFVFFLQWKNVQMEYGNICSHAALSHFLSVADSCLRSPCLKFNWCGGHPGLFLLL